MWSAWPCESRIVSMPPADLGAIPASKTRPNSGTARDVYTPPTVTPRTAYGPAVSVVSARGVYRPPVLGYAAYALRSASRPGGVVSAVGGTAGTEAHLGIQPDHHEVLLSVALGCAVPAPALVRDHGQEREVSEAPQIG